MSEPKKIDFNSGVKKDNSVNQVEIKMSKSDVKNVIKIFPEIEFTQAQKSALEEIYLVSYQYASGFKVHHPSPKKVENLSRIILVNGKNLLQYPEVIEHIIKCCWSFAKWCDGRPYNFGGAQDFEDELRKVTSIY